MEYLAVPGAVLAVFAVFAVLGRFALNVYRFMKGLDEQLSYIRHEMQLNGGRTMRDAVARIEAKLDEIEHDRLDVIEERQLRMLGDE